jgi:hypothetical protein
VIFCGVPIFNGGGFPYQNETHTATSYGASPMKKQQKTVIVGEKLCVINQLEKVKTFLIYNMLWA